MSVFAIVNPISGAGADAHAATRRVALLRDRCATAGIDADVRVTDHAGHAAALAREALGRGVHAVFAWGGDGTINEVGSVLAGTNAALAIVPAGSGNGFARALGIPRKPADAIDAGLHGLERLVDVGELNGRFFFNVAGVGVDARIAERFNACERGRRGLGPYVRIGVAEAFRYRARTYEVDLDGTSFARRVLLAAFANGREYGNRICLAPAARLDDGRLDAVVVDDRPPVSRLLGSRHVFFGRIDRASGVTVRLVQRAEIRSADPIPFHVDGEHGVADRVVTIRIRPGYLRVRVPPEERSAI
jgi:YegS/Rv2252/BmrU family lipid kinase